VFKELFEAIGVGEEREEIVVRELLLFCHRVTRNKNFPRNKQRFFFRRKKILDSSTFSPLRVSTSMVSFFKLCGDQQSTIHLPRFHVPPSTINRDCATFCKFSSLVEKRTSPKNSVTRSMKQHKTLPQSHGTFPWTTQCPDTTMYVKWR